MSLAKLSSDSGIDEKKKMNTKNESREKATVGERIYHNICMKLVCTHFHHFFFFSYFVGFFFYFIDLDFVFCFSLPFSDLVFFLRALFVDMLRKRYLFR